jgi:hypothetical protein
MMLRVKVSSTNLNLLFYIFFNKSLNWFCFFFFFFFFFFSADSLFVGF